MPTAYEKKIQSYRIQVQRFLTELLPQPQPALLYDAMRYALASPGKLLRPTLLLLCCEAVGGHYRRAMNAAVALELIHNFTLVHDDIMDRDSLRRGRETVYKKWDESVAILAGDGLLVLAFSLLADSKWPQNNKISLLFCRAILEVCEGQALDKEFETRPIITVDEYYEMINKKTARLFELACETGAMIGNGNRQQIFALKKYGSLLGRAFQIQDDLLDVVGEESVIGKDVGSDLKANKKTFLIAHAFQFATAKQSITLKKLLFESDINADTIRTIIVLLNEIGTIPAARQEIDQCLQSAASCLNVLPESNAKQHLLTMVKQLASRDR